MRIKEVNTKGIYRQACGLASLLPVLLAAVLPLLLLAGCMDETLVSVSYGVASGDEDTDADMYLSVNVPRSTFTTTPSEKESAVEELDVLVFKAGEGEDAGKYFVYAACKGTPVTESGTKENTFQVIMPVGTGLIVHVFANCHDALVAKNFYNRRGEEMNATLALLTTATNVNADDVTALPMHGFLKGVDIDKTQVNTTRDVTLLRSVAAVQIMTKATETTVDGKTVYTPGKVTDEDGNEVFDLLSAYIYYYPESARIAADPKNYEPIVSGGKDITRNVLAESLPADHRVSETYADEAKHPDAPRPYSLGGTEKVQSLSTFYLYENKSYSKDGTDYPDPDAENPVATTRLVVGGIYKDKAAPDGTAKVTYYRVDFADKDRNPKSILRNHKYTFSIEKVTDWGYDTPDEAARGTSVNIFVKTIEWADELTNSDYNSENFFNSETKAITLYRAQSSQRSITVSSDVAADKWTMSFANNDNGAATVSGNTIENNRYKVEKATDGKSLTFTALKAYSPLSGTEKNTETLIIKANRLEVVYKITQINSSPDDWAGGGDQEVIIEGKPITLEGMAFEVAPGNLVGYKDAEGNWKYRFANSQGDYSGKWDGGDYFNWSCSDPLAYTDNIKNSAWTTDFCTKVTQLGGGWRIPTSGELEYILKQQPRVYGTYVNSKGKPVNGYYSGTNDKAKAEGAPHKYIFLPSAGFRQRSSTDMKQQGFEGYYWASNGGYNLEWYAGGGLGNSTKEDRFLGFSLRCVRGSK